MNNQNKMMIDDMDSIIKSNGFKKEGVNSLILFLEANGYQINLKETTGTDNLSLGYELLIFDLLSGSNSGTGFNMINKPELHNLIFEITPYYSVGGNEIRLFYTLLGFILQSKIKLKFNLDMLQSALSRFI